MSEFYKRTEKVDCISTYQYRKGMRSHLLPLTRMLEAGIVRANTRLCRSDDLAREIKFQIILPKKHPVTELIVNWIAMKWV